MKRVVSSMNEKRQVLSLNMTSMIDVIFLLLIFFVFTTNFNEIEKILPMSLNLPGKGAAEKKPELVPVPVSELHIKILMAQDGSLSWVINDQEYRSESDLTMILQRTAETDRNWPVVIQPAETVTVESVLDLYGICRSVGLSKIRFAAKKSK